MRSDIFIRGCVRLFVGPSVHPSRVSRNMAFGHLNYVYCVAFGHFIAWFTDYCLGRLVVNRLSFSISGNDKNTGLVVTQYTTLRYCERHKLS